MPNNLNQLQKDFEQKALKITGAIDKTIPVLVGEMLVDGFRQSFDMQKFNDTGTAPWKQVKRRETGQPWFGFNYKPNYKVPPGSRGVRANGKPRKYGTRGGKTNYSPMATTRNILLGCGSGNLRDSINLASARRGRIVVASDQEHAQVHNEGGQARIFGRKLFRMPKRQFMGHSDTLNKRAKRIIDNVLTDIVK